MGKILKFPNLGKETSASASLAERYNRSLPSSSEEQAQYRRSLIRVLKGGISNGESQ